MSTKFGEELVTDENSIFQRKSFVDALFASEGEAMSKEPTCHSCNAHDDLVAALEDALSTIEWMAGCTSPAEDEVDRAITELRTAIAKAKGQPMPMCHSVYILTTYEYDTYSYSEISEQGMYVHATKEGAEAHATELGLTVVEYCKDPDKEATIDREPLRA